MITKLIRRVGKVPVVGQALRRIASRSPEGSIARIRFGVGKGLLWTRSKRYVNGYWLGVYESSIQDVLARELRPGHVFYDVGANAGFFSLIGSRLVGPSGKVFAFEPMSENADFLEQQMRINQVGNVRLIRCAAGENVGRALLRRSGAMATANVVASQDADGSEIAIDVTTIDDVAKSNPPPDFVKIDVEGAELSVLRGALNVIRGHRPSLLLELHSPALATEARKLLRAEGYDILDLRGVPVGDDSYREHVIARPLKS